MEYNWRLQSLSSPPPCGEGQGWGSGIANRFARNLRRNATGAERILWQQLRLLKAEGFHFRKQVPNWDCDNLILLEMARPRDPHPYPSPQGATRGRGTLNSDHGYARRRLAYAFKFPGLEEWSTTGGSSR